MQPSLRLGASVVAAVCIAAFVLGVAWGFSGTRLRCGVVDRPPAANSVTPAT
jgi:hypothetical protein